MDKTTTEIVKLKLDELFNGRGSFSICDIWSLGALIGVNVKSHPDYEKLNALHCVDYRKMSDELKTEITTMVMNCLSSRFETDLMAKALAAVRNGEIKDEPFIEDCSSNVYLLSKKS